MPHISTLHARSILDSRGNPTVEVDLTLSDGSMGRAAVPSGASKGSREALELRDGDADEYLGRGVEDAIEHIHTTITQSLGDKEWIQESLDQHLIELDGTEHKSRLGANAILGVSLSFAVASAESNKQPLYAHLAQLSHTAKPALPRPILNIMNGGAHANWTTDIQEYILIPMGGEVFSEQLRKAEEVYQYLGQIIAKKGLSTNVGNEGGYAPELSSNEEAFELIMEAVTAAGYSCGRDKDFMLGIDAAATQFFADGQYVLKRDATTKTTEEMITWLKSLTEKFPICQLEDPLSQDDWAGWSALRAALPERIRLIGDDLTVTNPQYVQQAINGKCCDGLIAKPNQIGTLSETLAAMKLAREAGWITIASHRSGETEDTFISHLAVGTASEQIKTGAPSRTDRTAKYNELLRIEEQLIAS
jgi:enolase